MASAVPVCLGSSACAFAASPGVVVPGYYCKQDTCIKCPVGTFGANGKTCSQCTFATWAPSTGSSKCLSSFSYLVPGIQKSYVPFGVTKIVVKLWGAGGGSDSSLDSNYVAYSGGGGGFSSCNITVPHSKNVYLIIGGGGGAKSLTNNLGG